MAYMTIRIHPSDNETTALEALPAGTPITFAGEDPLVPIILVDAIDFGHKFAVCDIAAGGDVVKYGACIGRASRAIRPGEHVHVHNTESNRGRGDLPSVAQPSVECGGKP